MTTYRQLTIWDVLDELSESPATSTLAPMWECLDAELEKLPLEAQLLTAAREQCDFVRSGQKQAIAKNYI
ncbi:hypothetical protein [Nostoc sp.]|uniref:hypothetical protein n=1 Tax=Nostoc sp. TaxID=1180 RepID=UPI002FFA8913